MSQERGLAQIGPTPEPAQERRVGTESLSGSAWVRAPRVPTVKPGQCLGAVGPVPATKYAANLGFGGMRSCLVHHSLCLRTCCLPC